MKKDYVKLSSLPDSVVMSLRCNSVTTLWYNGIEIVGINALDNPGTLNAKYRITTNKGQYRENNPTIEITW